MRANEVEWSDRAAVRTRPGPKLLAPLAKRNPDWSAERTCWFFGPKAEAKRTNSKNNIRIPSFRLGFPDGCLWRKALVDFWVLFGGFTADSCKIKKKSNLLCVFLGCAPSARRRRRRIQKDVLTNHLITSLCSF